MTKPDLESQAKLYTRLINDMILCAGGMLVLLVAIAGIILWSAGQPDPSAYLPRWLTANPAPEAVLPTEGDWR